MDNRSDDQKALSQQDSSIMASNGLLYKMPQSLSTTVKRTFQKEYAHKTSYSGGQTITFELNTGSTYVDPENAMLSFDLTVVAGTSNGTDAYTFGTNTCGALFSECRIISKNGTEIDRIQGCNILSKILLDYETSVEGQKMLQMAGYGQTTLFSATAKKFVIPMKLLTGFFRPIVKGMKIPAGLASGARIELTLASAERALEVTVGAGTVVSVTYTVDNPELLLMCHELNDPTQAILMRNSAATGLEYSFPSYYHTHTTGTDSYNIQISKAVSQCTKVFATAFVTADVADFANDGFESIASSALTNYQYRVGQTYYPQKAVDSPVEAWYVSESAFDKNRDLHTNPSNVTLADYDSGGKFIVAHPLETSDRHNLSGISLNNSNVCELRLTLNGGTARDLDIFIEFVTVAKTFINKTSIKI